MATLAEKFLPAYDVSDSVATVVGAEPEAVYEALLEVDMVEVGRRKKVAGTLIGLRVLPLLLTKMLRGREAPKAPARLTLKESTEIPAADGGWVLLDEKPGRGAGARAGRAVLAAGDRLPRRLRRGVRGLRRARLREDRLRRSG